MLTKLKNKFMEKSLKERFLLFIGFLFFLIYLTFGFAVIFWKRLPLSIEPKYKIALGILLIAYGSFRFYRYFNSNSDQ